MSLTYQILGSPGRDNALLVTIDTGQGAQRLLFDCGEGCLSELGLADVQAVDHLFFSHLHMDHIGGFDTFFRCTFGRDTRPNRIWGPPQTIKILQHRFQGFLWNLHQGMSATWRVSDVYSDRIHTCRFELGEAFAVAHEEEPLSYHRTLCTGDSFRVEAVTMDHRTPTLAYIVPENARRNIDTARMTAMGLQPGPWVKQVKDPSGGNADVVIGGVTHSLEALRRDLLVETPGDSIAYLTDFLLDEAAMDRLVPYLQGCRTVVCEGQYRHTDLELAQRNYHMTTVLAATLAKRAAVGELVLFHLSDRYTPEVWLEMLQEARQVFPNTRYPEGWKLGCPDVT
jgi:ribonuclease Z